MFIRTSYGSRDREIELSPKVASGRKHGTVSDNTYICPIIAVSEF